MVPGILKKGHISSKTCWVWWRVPWECLWVDVITCVLKKVNFRGYNKVVHRKCLGDKLCGVQREESELRATSSFEVGRDGDYIVEGMKDYRPYIVKLGPRTCMRSKIRLSRTKPECECVHMAMHVVCSLGAVWALWLCYWSSTFLWRETHCISLVRPEHDSMIITWGSWIVCD